MEPMSKHFWDLMRLNHPKRMMEFAEFLVDYYGKKSKSTMELVFSAIENYESSPLEIQLGIFILFEDSKQAEPKNHLSFTLQGLIQSDFSVWNSQEEMQEKLKTQISEGNIIQLKPRTEMFKVCDGCTDAYECCLQQECLKLRVN